VSVINFHREIEPANLLQYIYNSEHTATGFLKPRDKSVYKPLLSDTLTTAYCDILECGCCVSRFAKEFRAMLREELQWRVLIRRFPMSQ
jgi:hypothetical protein